MFRDLPGFDDWRADYTSHLERTQGPDPDDDTDEWEEEPEEESDT